MNQHRGHHGSTGIRRKSVLLGAMFLTPAFLMLVNCSSSEPVMTETSAVRSTRQALTANLQPTSTVFVQDTLAVGAATGCSPAALWACVDDGAVPDDSNRIRGTVPGGDGNVTFGYTSTLRNITRVTASWRDINPVGIGRSYVAIYDGTKLLATSPAHTASPTPTTSSFTVEGLNVADAGALRTTVYMDNDLGGQLSVTQVFMDVVAADVCTPESDDTFCARLAKNCGTVSAIDNCGEARSVDSCGKCKKHPEGGDEKAKDNNKDGNKDTGHRDDDVTCGGGSVPNACGSIVSKGSLEIPKVSGSPGHRTNVGLVVFGHSTSNRGDWPTKLRTALNSNEVGDGRNYVVLRSIVENDGGLGWKRLKFEPGDPDYNHIKATGTTPPQYCAAGATRWSCRRVAFERQFTNAPVGACDATCGVPSGMLIAECDYYDANNQLVQYRNVPYKDCLSKMDNKIALIQDTTNRSWPVDDTNTDTGAGVLDDSDYFLVSQVKNPAGALPWACQNGRSGVIPLNGKDYVDWDCDGQLTRADASRSAYKDILKTFSTDLVDNYGFDYAILTHKPIETGQNGPAFTWFPGEVSSFHGVRSATSNLSRPFDRFYAPAVYWEHTAIEALVNDPTVDPRIKALDPGAYLTMWDRSARCFTTGLSAADWTIPSSVPGRASDTLDPDDGETDGLNSQFVGCMDSDHIHQTAAGGWMMADVWYAGLKPYLFP